MPIGNENHYQPSEHSEHGRFTLGNATAIVTLGTTTNHASASELCRSNGLDLTEAALSIIHGTGLEEEVLLLINVGAHQFLHINFRQYLH